MKAYDAHRIFGINRFVQPLRKKRRLIPISALDEPHHEVPPRFDAAPYHASRTYWVGSGFSHMG